jgi:hypothetical protein
MPLRPQLEQPKEISLAKNYFVRHSSDCRFADAMPDNQRRFFLYATLLSDNCLVALTRCLPFLIIPI